MTFLRKKEEPKAKYTEAEVAQVAARIAQHSQAAQPRPDRPLLDQIHAARLNKTAEMNRLASEVDALRRLEEFMEDHTTSDSLVQWFIKNLGRERKIETEEKR